jgi:hypothetical protein
LLAASIDNEDEKEGKPFLIQNRNPRPLGVDSLLTMKLHWQELADKRDIWRP